MLKRNTIIFFSCLAVLGIGAFIILLYSHNRPKLEYIIDKSYHHAFSIDGDSVYLRNDITLKNNSSEQLNFYMIANISDEQLVSEDQVYAYNPEHLDEKQLFTIAPHTTETYYNVIFKGSSTEKTTKNDRLPPKEITFEIVK